MLMDVEFYLVDITVVLNIVVLQDRHLKYKQSELSQSLSPGNFANKFTHVTKVVQLNTRGRLLNKLEAGMKHFKSVLNCLRIYQ